MRPAVILGAGLLALSAAASPAQKPLARYGLSAAVGGGVGSIITRCTYCDGNRVNAGSGLLRIGLGRDSNWVWTAQLRAWQTSGIRESSHYEALLAGAQFYPWRSRGLHAEGAVGYGRTFVARHANGDELTAGAPALMVGVGYDLRLASTFAIIPFANFLAASRTYLDVNGIQTGTMQSELVQLGFSFAWLQKTRRPYIPAGERGRQ